jgi:hypothetical protein
MLLLDVPVRDVHVLQRGVVVLVGVGGQQVSPVLSPVQVVRDVIVLVPVRHGFVPMMPLLSCHCSITSPLAAGRVHRPYIGR